MWGKASCAGFVLPVMNYLQGLIAYHVGLRFFMKKIPTYYPTFNTATNRFEEIAYVDI